MRQIVILSPLFALIVMGCATAYMSPAAIREAEATANAAYADCNTQLRQGKLKSFRQAVECAEPPVVAAYQGAGYPYMDLIQFDLNARMHGAEEIDVGAASEADVDRDIAVLETRINQEQQRRMDYRAQTGGAAPDMPLDQLTVGVGLNALNGRAPPPTASDCFKVGSLTNCPGGVPPAQ
jgi:hypothetical protein